MVSHSPDEWIGLSLVTATSGAGTAYHLIRVISGSFAKGWPVVFGKVTSSRVKEIPGRFGHTYQPLVEYEYAVAGVTYTGNQRRFDDDDYEFKSSATERLVRYSPGVALTVYYDPGDPSTSVLEPGSEWHSYINILSFGAWFIVGLLALLGYLK